MAKISDRQKSNILAKWKTGEYSKVQLAKTYRVTEGAIRKIVGNQEPTNKGIVEVQAELEILKKYDKSTIEIAEIDKAVKYRIGQMTEEDQKEIRVNKTAFALLDRIQQLAESGKKKTLTKVEHFDEGKKIMTTMEEKEVDISPTDIKNMTDGVDKISLTTNVNQRHANSQVNINNTNAQQNIFPSIDEFYK